MLLLVEHDEGGHTQLLRAEQLHALLRGLRVGHDQEVERAARGRDGTVIFSLQRGEDVSTFV